MTRRRCSSRRSRPCSAVTRRSGWCVHARQPSPQLAASGSASLNFNVVVSGASAATTAATSLAATVTTAVSDNTFATALANARTTLSYSGSAMSNVVATGACRLCAVVGAYGSAVPSPKTSPPWWVYAWWVYALAAVALLMVLIAVLQCVRKRAADRSSATAAAPPAQREVDAGVEVELTVAKHASLPPAPPPRPSRPPRPIRNDATPGRAPRRLPRVMRRGTSETRRRQAGRQQDGLVGQAHARPDRRGDVPGWEQAHARPERNGQRASRALATRAAGLAHVATVAWVSLRQGVAGEAWARSPLVCGCSDSLLRPHAADRARHQQRLHQVWGA